jgi:hypothetical protein
VQEEGAQSSRTREARIPESRRGIRREVFLWVIGSPDTGVEEHQSSPACEGKKVLVERPPAARPGLPSRVVSELGCGSSLCSGSRGKQVHNAAQKREAVT